MGSWICANRCGHATNSLTCGDCGEGICDVCAKGTNNYCRSCHKKYWKCNDQDCGFDHCGECGECGVKHCLTNSCAR